MFTRIIRNSALCVSVVLILFLVYCLYVKYGFISSQTTIDKTQKVVVSDSLTVKVPLIFMSNNHGAWQQYIREIDISGLIGGIATFIIGYLLTLSIEDKNAVKEKELKENVTALSRSSNSISSNITGLSDEVKNVREISDMLLTKIEGLVVLQVNIVG